EFTLVTDSLGKVLVTDFNLSWDGYSTPYIFRAQDGKMRLISGSEQGIIYYYTDIENNLLGSFTPSDELWKLIDSVEFTINKGYRTSAAIANLNGDAYLDMLIGNFSGGLNIYSTGLEPEVSMDIPDEIAEATFGLQVYPNPANHLLNIRVNGTQADESYIIRMYNLTGRLIFEDQFNGSNAYSLNTSTFPGGIYLCSVSDAKNYNARVTRRIIIRH
ncbi:MAG: T9SS type A sorting domain-containing protein, partial [Bacteroidales bacterium]|nr:T9SS type A sorting domain-containing protein [Bacteroidales bacterium]